MNQPFRIEAWSRMPLGAGLSQAAGVKRDSKSLRQGMLAVSQREKGGGAIQSGFINRHYHFQRFHSIVPTASRLTFFFNRLQPILDNSPVCGRKTCFRRFVESLPRRMFAALTQLFRFQNVDSWINI